MSNTTTDPGRRGPGLFIVFEGVEGAGKSTQIRRVAERLRGLEVPHRLVREPGGTAVGERVREILLDPGLEMCAETELMLVLGARAEFVRRLIRPALEAGELVLSDRYELSTFAYQGAGRGLGMDLARQWNRRATEGLTPDLTILLLVSPELGRGRQSGDRDRLEREREEFYVAVATAYEQLAESDASILTIRTEGSSDDVHERIWNELVRRWPDRFGRPESGTGGNFSASDEFHEGGTARGGAQIEAADAEEEQE